MHAITHHVTIASPVGPLCLAASEDRLCLIQFSNERKPRQIDARAQRLANSAAHPVLAQAQGQLQAYFAGELQTFALPLAPDGTAFQRQTWQALTAIAYGQTISYAELAARIGRPSATRAVGAANGRNPLPIVVPCHRVIGANGVLTGFSGGVHIKAFLLGLEAQSAAPGSSGRAGQSPLFAQPRPASAVAA